MGEGRRRAGRSRLVMTKNLPPDWFGWLCTVAMFLLFLVKLPAATPWLFPLMSLGEWLLLPLGALSLSMGLLSLRDDRESRWLPFWLAGIAPAVVWLAAVGTTMLWNRATSVDGDYFLAWAVHLVFPTLAFLPILSHRLWRNRLMWSLTAGVCVNILVHIGLTARTGADAGTGGLLADQYALGAMLAVSIPLILAWNGGERPANRSLITLFCTFLLPAVALSVLTVWSGLAAASLGLVVTWVSWRRTGWILGIFVGLLVFGYGSEGRRERETANRSAIAGTALPDLGAYRTALDSFVSKPYQGSSLAVFGSDDGRHLRPRPGRPVPWYASLLGGSGLIGLGLWLVLLAELAARALGRAGKRCLWSGGVLGSVMALLAAGIWSDVMTEGVGALIGLLLAVSILEEPDLTPSPRRVAKHRQREVAENAEAARRETMTRDKTTVALTALDHPDENPGTPPDVSDSGST